MSELPSKNHEVKFSVPISKKSGAPTADWGQEPVAAAGIAAAAADLR
jgi:hypothetical protein